MSPQLAQCMWCGSDALPSTRDPIRPEDQPTHHIRCRACHATGPRASSREAAIAAWNTRALEREAKAEPVAWRVRIPRGTDAYEIRFASIAEQLREMEAKWPLALVEPLYASPPAPEAP